MQKTWKYISIKNENTVAYLHDVFCERCSAQLCTPSHTARAESAVVYQTSGIHPLGSSVGRAAYPSLRMTSDQRCYHKYWLGGNGTQEQSLRNKNVTKKKSRVYCSKHRDQTGSFQSHHSFKRDFNHGCTRKFTIHIL